MVTWLENTLLSCCIKLYNNLFSLKKDDFSFNLDYFLKNTRKTVLFGFLTFCLVIAFLEIFLTFTTIVSPRVKELLSQKAVSHTIPDERLGYRPNPEFPGHDSKGFRNPTVPNKAKIVALGDSQTYGAGVDSQDTWPRQFEKLSGYTVYSMAFGGYGPVHSLILWEEASSLNPEIYIEAFYSGNDLFDSLDLVYNQEQLPFLNTSNKDTELSIRKMEMEEPKMQQAAGIFWQGKDTKETSKRSVSFTRKYLLSHSKLYGLARQAKHTIFQKKTELEWKEVKKTAGMHPDFFKFLKTDNSGQYLLPQVDFPSLI